MRTSVTLAALIAALFSTAVFAGIAPTPIATTTAGSSSETSRTTTRAYVGLNWSLGGGYTPALVLGVTNAKVKSDGDMTGARLAFHLKLAGGVAPGMLKLSYLNGKEDVQGELGVGYNFIKAAPSLGLAINGRYVAAGVDAYMGSGLVPYVTLSSQGAFSKPNPRVVAGETVYSCPSGYTFDPPDSCVGNF